MKEDSSCKYIPSDTSHMNIIRKPSKIRKGWWGEGLQDLLECLEIIRFYRELSEIRTLIFEKRVR